MKEVIKKYGKMFEELLKDIEANTFKESCLKLNCQNLEEEDIESLVLALNCNPHVMGLELVDSKVSDKGCQVLSTLQHVIELDLTLNQINVEGAKSLSHASFKRLKLDGNAIEDDGISAFAQNAHLVELQASECRIGDKGTAAILLNKTLIKLSLQNNGVTDKGIANLVYNDTLQDLNLSQNFITKIGATSIAQNKVLKILDVSNNSLGEDGAIIIANDNKVLVKLNLSQNEVGDKGAQALAENEALKILILFNNKIGNKGAKKLLENDSLTDLNLAFNQIDQDCSSEIFSNKDKFNSLNLSGNLIPKEILTNFRQKRSFSSFKSDDKEGEIDISNSKKR